MPRLVVTKPVSETSRIWAMLAFWAGALFVVCLAALHILKPDLDPSWRFISEYELGAFGWMMRLAFLALALSCIGLGAALLSQVPTIGGVIGLALLAVSAAGMILAAIVAPDPNNHIHELGAVLDSVPLAAPLIAWSLSRNAGWQTHRGTLFATMALPLLGLVVYMASMAIFLPRNGGHPGSGVLVGWPNRIMIVAHCAWIMPVAWMVMNAPHRSMQR